MTAATFLIGAWAVLLVGDAARLLVRFAKRRRR